MLDWIKAAGIRAGKTFAQTILGMIAIGAAFQDIDWIKVLSVAVVAAFISLLTSIKGLPELKEVPADGELNIKTSSTGKITYKLELNEDIETLADKSVVRFDVKK